MFSQRRNINRFLVLFLLFFFVISGADRVLAANHVINILPSDLMDTKADSDATPPVEAQSAADKVAKKIAMADPGDTVMFPGGATPYPNVGEILITKSGEPNDDPATATDEGDGPITFEGAGTIFTGKIMFNVKASHIVIKGFTFRETEVPAVVTVRLDDPGTAGTDDPVRYGFPGMTVEAFLKSKDSAYSGGASPGAGYVDDDSSLANNAELWVAVASPATTAAAGIANKATGGLVTDAGTNDFAIWGEGITSAKAKNSLGTVWVDSVIPSGTCRMSSGASPMDIQIAGVVVRNNMFSMTELAGVRAGNPSTVSDTTPCKPQVDVIGNTFTNIGHGGKEPALPFVKGRMDSNGNMIAEIGNRMPAIDVRNARAAMITDNTIGMASDPPGTSDAIVVRDTPAKAVISVSNNRITNPMLNGILIADDAVQAAEDDAAKITVSGNEISGTNGNRYLTAPFKGGGMDDPVVEGYESERDTKCNDGGGVSATNEQKAASNLMLDPEVWRSRSTAFPFPDTGAPRALVDSEGNVPSEVSAAIGDTDLVRYKAAVCFDLGSVKVVNQEGVSVTNNDLGSTADGEYSLDTLPYGVVVEGDTDDTELLTAFRGNNIDFYSTAAVQKEGGDALAVAGNYLGGPVRSSRLTGDAEPDRIESDEDDPRVIGPRDEVVNFVSLALEGVELNEAGTMITLTYNKDLDERSTPSRDAFTVEKSSDDFDRASPVRVSTVRVSERTVTLTLAAAIEAGDAVRIAYEMPGTADRIQDEMGNPAPDTEGPMMVTNNVGTGGGGTMTPTPPTATAGGGDGGCALASAGGAGVDLGALALLPLMAVPFAFAARRKTGDDRSGV